MRQTWHKRGSRLAYRRGFALGGGPILIAGAVQGQHVGAQVLRDRRSHSLSRDREHYRIGIVEFDRTRTLPRYGWQRPVGFIHVMAGLTVEHHEIREDTFLPARIEDGLHPAD